MKQYTASCDGGCLQIGNDSFNLKISNGYGDCDFSVFICSEREFFKDFKDVPNSKEYKWMGSIEGEFNVYAYDCDKEEMLDTLRGKYGIYLLSNPFDSPSFVLVKHRESRTYRVWKYSSRPFTFGGSYRTKVTTTLMVDTDEIIKHEGFELIPVTIDCKSYVFDAYSGGLVGNSIEQVKADIDSCIDKDFIRKQIESEKVKGESAIPISKEEFFAS